MHGYRELITLVHPTLQTRNPVYLCITNVDQESWNIEFLSINIFFYFFFVIELRKKQ